MPSSNTNTSMKTVLFVDDDERVLRALEASFEDIYNVIIESKPKEALKILASQAVDIIVSDQRMPEMLGYQLLASARKIRPNAIRILMTGYSDKKSIIETINKGEVFRFVTKPWSVKEFTEILAQASNASEAGHIEKPRNESSSSSELSPQDRWSDAKSKLGYSPSVLMYTRVKYRKSLLKVASKDIDAKIFISSSLSTSLEAIMKNKDIGIIFIEMTALNADIVSALAMLRRTRPEVVVMILTNASDFEVAVKLINHGQAFRYLAEPIDIEILTSSLLAALDRHIQLCKFKDAALRYESDTRKLNIGEKVIRLFAKLTGNKTKKGSA